MTCLVAARNIVSNCYFPVGRSFSCSTAGWPSLRWVGLTNASLQPAPVRAAPVRAACCRGLRVRRVWRSLFFFFIPSHACRPSISIARNQLQLISSNLSSTVSHGSSVKMPSANSRCTRLLSHTCCNFTIDLLWRCDRSKFRSSTRLSWKLCLLFL